ncbi:FAD:protein FMN transferase [Terribacillus saccharophilus]|uniref:FAD:protein FMN transferase n=1 Tax=Terribacillus saccharophilus TaxID=361277 RepID=A0ABX4H2V1_9BACI|nr:FAD:protein FMN transferase [Terribacillus saccharophilus]PAD37118.1 hypothetical protein CHH56_00820 [Terribacillus saccharophilus]PAD97407.1 hypothetical protein CHH50_01525 [Terribacillus saccharophilus]PAE01455.1 hypothetical protein CHH48_01515 [Terribacillus saccharophilus]
MYSENSSIQSGNSSRFTFKAIGTHWEIETSNPLKNRLKNKILNRIELYDQTYSRFRHDSLVSQIAQSQEGGRFDFPNDSVKLFKFYEELCTLTDGAVDPLVGRDLELLGYDKEYTFLPKKATVLNQEKPSWLTDIDREATSIVTKKPLVIDVGAAGKGYLVDIVSEILLEEGFIDFIVDGSGDIRHVGKDNVAIGLEHPLHPNKVVGVIRLSNQAICASAINRRAWGDGLHHILHARTGTPVKNVIATWVVANNCMIADGLATALFFETGYKLAKDFTLSYVRMFADGTVEISDNFEGDIFTE